MAQVRARPKVLSPFQCSQHRLRMPVAAFPSGLLVHCQLNLMFSRYPPIRPSPRTPQSALALPVQPAPNPDASSGFSLWHAGEWQSEYHVLPLTHSKNPNALVPVLQLKIPDPGKLQFELGFPSPIYSPHRHTSNACAGPLLQSSHSSWLIAHSTIP